MNIRHKLRLSLLASCLFSFSVSANEAAVTEYKQASDSPSLIQADEGKIIEDILNGTWKGIKSKIPSYFPIGKGPKGLSVIAGILEKALVPISILLDEYSIEHGSYVEFLTYLPPNFNDNMFSISAYDAYNTEGMFTGELSSKTNETLFQVKVYPEFAANDPTTYTLKNLETLDIPLDAHSQNLVLEFYTADGAFVDDMVLPAKTNSKNFGITLAKTKQRNHVYYLKKEIRHHITSTWTISKLMDPLYEYPAYDKNTVEKRLDARDPSEAAAFENFVWMKAAKSSKFEMSSHQSYYDGTVFQASYILSLWQSPKWTLRGEWTAHKGENYYSDFITNATVSEGGGLMLGDKGKATYQLYVPKDGTYSVNFSFTNTASQTVTINNSLTGDLLYEVTLPVSTDGEPKHQSTRDVELDLEEGVLFLDINAKNVQVNQLFYKFLYNEIEDRQAYLETRYETIRLEIANAENYLREGSIKPLNVDSVQSGISQASFLLKLSIIPKMTDLTTRGYSLQEALISELNRQINHLDNSMRNARLTLDFLRSGKMILEAESIGTSVGIEDKTTFITFEESYAFKVFDIDVPETGLYSLTYHVANRELESSIYTIIDGSAAAETFTTVIAPSYGEFIQKNEEDLYLEQGFTKISLHRIKGYDTFDLDKIEIELKQE